MLHRQAKIEQKKDDGKFTIYTLHQVLVSRKKHEHAVWYSQIGHICSLTSTWPIEEEAFNLNKVSILLVHIGRQLLAQICEILRIAVQVLEAHQLQRQRCQNY